MRAEKAPSWTTSSYPSVYLARTAQIRRRSIWARVAGALIATQKKIKMRILLKNGVFGHFFGVLVVACVPGAIAAPFADKDALKTAVIRCINAVPSGENCCSLGVADCGAAGTDDMPEWDTSLVTDMGGVFIEGKFTGGGMFTDATAFNQPIGSWNTSQVTNMGWMFKGATAFNQPIGDWDTSQVTNMRAMFEGAAAFNQQIGEWDTSQVTNMYGTFTYASAFNQPIGSWNTSQVTWMARMFEGAVAFNHPIGDWDTSKVTGMWNMFSGATVFNQTIGTWNTSQVGDMDEMFCRASAFSKDITNWRTPSLYRSSHMFDRATAWHDAFVHIDGIAWNLWNAWDGPPSVWTRCGAWCECDRVCYSDSGAVHDVSFPMVLAMTTFNMLLMTL